MKDLIDIEVETIERVYLEANFVYRVEQTILNSLSKKELEQVIRNLNMNYNILKTKFNLKLNTKKKKQSYIKGSEIDKAFIEIYHYVFEGGKQIDDLKYTLNKLKNYHKLNHTDFLKRNDYKQVDVKSVSIRDVINIYTRLPDSLRRNIRCMLPHHRDRIASFKVYEDNNSWYCFGCHRGGDAVKFIAEMEGIESKQAFKKLVNLISK